MDPRDMLILTLKSNGNKILLDVSRISRVIEDPADDPQKEKSGAVVYYERKDAPELCLSVREGFNTIDTRLRLRE